MLNQNAQGFNSKNKAPAEAAPFLSMVHANMSKKVLLGLEANALPYLRIVHSPNAFEGQTVLVGYSAMLSVDKYLASVSDRLNQRGKAGAYCPFVRSLEGANAYYVKIFGNAPRELDALNALNSLLDAYSKIPPVYINGSKFDYKALVYGFGHPAARTEEFCTMFSKLAGENRLSFKSAGLMLGEFHPFHSLGGRQGGSEPMFVSEIPIYIVRSMHKSDSVFMKSDEDVKAYGAHYSIRPPVLQAGFLGC